MRTESVSRPTVAAKCSKARSEATKCPANAARSGRRICAFDECSTRLSRYNPGTHCVTHEHMEAREVDAAEVIPAVRATMKTPSGKTRHVGPWGAPATAVRDLILKHDDGADREVYASRLGIDARVLYSILRLRSRRGGEGGRPLQVVSTSVLDRILSGLGLEHTRDQWGCFA